MSGVQGDPLGILGEGQNKEPTPEPVRSRVIGDPLNIKTGEARARAMREQIDAIREGASGPTTPVFPPELQGQQIARGDQPGMLRNIPDVRDDRPAGLSANFKAAIPDDMETKKRIYAEAIFPDDPKAINRFGTFNNEIVYLDDRGNLQRAQSNKLAARGARFAADLPEMVGGGVGAAVGGVPGAMLGSAAGEAFKDIGSNVIFDEPQSAAGNAGGIALEAGMGLAGEVGGKAIAKASGSMALKRGIRDAAKVDPADVSAIAKRVKIATGIDLDVAQIVDLASVTNLKKWASKHPSEAADIMRANEQLQQGQVSEAITTVLDAVSKQNDRAALTRGGINAAQAAIEAAKSQRARLTSDLYEQAFNSGTAVDTLPVIDTLDDLIARSGGNNKRKLLQLKRDFFDTPKKGKATGDASAEAEPIESLQELHGLRMDLDDKLEKNPANSAGSNLRRSYTIIRQSLDDAMKTASPELREADKLFSETTAKIVTPLQDSIIGVLAKLPDGAATKAATTLFQSKDISPSTMNFLKTQITRADPEAWSGLVRLYLADSFDKALKITQTGNTPNVAGKFRQAIEGTPRQRAVIKTAIPQSARAIYDDVMEALEMVSRTPIGGSDTAFNELTSKGIAERANGVRRLITQPLQTVAEFGDARFMENHAIALAEGLTDPAKISRIKELGRISDKKRRSIEIASFLGLTESARSAAAGTNDVPDDIPTLQGQ